MTIDITGLQDLIGQAAVLGGFVYILLGAVFAQWEPPRQVKIGVSLAAPFVVAYAAWGVLVYLGQAPWTGAAALSVGGVALSAVLGSQGWHNAASRVHSHALSLAQLVSVNIGTIFEAATSISGVVAASANTVTGVGSSGRVLDARTTPDPALVEHLAAPPEGTL